MDRGSGQIQEQWWWVLDMDKAVFQDCLGNIGQTSDVDSDMDLGTVMSIGVALRIIIG